MTSSIPNSFNLNDLNKALQNAKDQNTLNAQVEKATEAIIAFEQEIDGPFASKLLAFVAILRLTNFHQYMTEQTIENNNAEQAAVFAHDTAILRTILQNFRQIHCGENDFLATND